MSLQYYRDSSPVWNFATSLWMNLKCNFGIVMLKHVSGILGSVIIHSAMSVIPLSENQCLCADLYGKHFCCNSKHPIKTRYTSYTETMRTSSDLLSFPQPPEQAPGVCDMCSSICSCFACGVGRGIISSQVPVHQSPIQAPGLVCVPR